MFRATDLLVLATLAFVSLGLCFAQMDVPKSTVVSPGMSAVPATQNFPPQWAVLPAGISISTHPKRRVWRMNVPSSALGTQAPPAWAAMIAGLAFGGFCLLDYYADYILTSGADLLPSLLALMLILTIYQTFRNLCPDMKLATS